MLEAWLGWAARCRIPAFVELGRDLRKNLAGIEAPLLHILSNPGRVDASEDAGPHPDGLRVPGARARHRLGPPRPGRLLPRPGPGGAEPLSGGDEEAARC